MFQLVHQYDFVTDPLGKPYYPRAYGQEQLDGMYGGWLVFFPASGGSVVSTDRETTQSTMLTLRDWALSLSLAYLQSALDRALELQPGPILAARLVELEAIEAQAADQAEILESAASIARRTASIAAKRRAETAADLGDAAADAARISAELHQTAADSSRRKATTSSGEKSGAKSRHGSTSKGR
jgi:hypothetical protein